MPSVQPLPLINHGKRGMIAGRTGSGKSTLGRWLLTRSPGYWIILNPKHTSAYNALPNSTTINGIDHKKLEKAMATGEHRFFVINPTSAQANFDYMDAFIEDIHDGYQNIGICADELYTLHKGGKAGEGLIAYLTRGRELGQSFLGLTQRPAWISKFLMSESDYIIGMSLNLDTDRKRMYEITGSRHFEEKLDPHYWLWYEAENDLVRKFRPVPA